MKTMFEQRKTIEFSTQENEMIFLRHFYGFICAKWHAAILSTVLFITIYFAHFAPKTIRKKASWFKK